MLKRYHQQTGVVFRIVDGTVVGLIWILSYWARFYLPVFEVTKGFPEFSQYAALTPVVILLWLAIFSGFQMYRSRRLLRRTDEVFQVAKAHGVALLFFIALTYLFSEYKYSRGVMIYFGVIGAFSLAFTRLGIRNFLRYARSQGYNLRTVLAVGEGESLEALLKKIKKFPELGLLVKGVLTAETQSNVKGSVPVLGTFKDIQKILTLERIDQVLIALPRSQYGQLDDILKSLGNAVVQVQVVPDVHEYVTLGCEIEDFDGLPIVHLNDSPLQGWGAIIKRLTDIFVSSAALVILSPLFLVIAVLVAATSAGPIFYRQMRMGLDGKTFWMIKFRSMRMDAETKMGPVWAKESDDRRTPIGTFLRATSLDELPQFWNVLKGEMSLVGPRPERPVFVDQFKQEIPGYMLRHKVKAGITGWAQVNGWRGNTSLDKRIEYDLFYIRNWSYFMDWKILLLTLIKGFINKNAY